MPESNPDEILNNTPLWWEVQNVPTPLIRELRRRNNSNNIGMNLSLPMTNTTFNFENDYKKYKGPMTPWVRVFSNSTGKPINAVVPASSYLLKNNEETNYDGYVLKGGEGFFDGFGYLQNKSLSEARAIIGYQANGEPHYIDNKYRSQTTYLTKQTSKYPQNNQTPSLLPPPGIISVNVKQSKELLTYASFKFQCYGLAQLEYMTPFFLTAGINVFIEFGWNLFNQKSLLNLSEIDECWEVVYKPQTAIDRSIISNGNYGCVTGIITNYNFNTNDGFLYDCNVELVSRQGLYAGMRTDNNARIFGSEENQEFISLKQFVKLYLPSINDVLKQPQKINKDPNPEANFLNYIATYSQRIAEKYFSLKKSQAEAKANQEQSIFSKLFQKLNNSDTNIKQGDSPIVSTKFFYNGKPEDRVFAGRNPYIYRNTKSPGERIPDSQFYSSEVGQSTISEGGLLVTNEPGVIKYGSIKNGNDTFDQVSFANEVTDFDAKDGNDEVWLQLDFVFEMFNLIMANDTTKQYYVDISSIIINAHPNLISCDKDVLIPNPISPKINIGRSETENKNRSGYLSGNNADPQQNKFLNQEADFTILPNTNYTKKINERLSGNLNTPQLTVDESYYLTSELVRKTFKTGLGYRDDIDIIINYLYYKSVNNNTARSASFPFAEQYDVYANQIAKLKGDNPIASYKKYYFGFFKNILISKSKLMQLVDREDIKNYKQLINAVLNTVNEAVDNFWKLEIVQGSNGELSIVDKNTANLNQLKEIYMFDVGGTNNVIKSFNFDVKLTSEQSVNILFGGQNSQNLATKYLQTVSNTTDQTQLEAVYNKLTEVPFLSFNDRLDVHQIKEFISKKSNSFNKTAQPGTPSLLVDRNNDIADLQIYGKKYDMLCMTVKNVKSGDNPNDPTDLTSLNYKYLTLPPSMKTKLRAILDDDDIDNNVAKFSGVADNFQVTITFDGLYGFRNLQVFALSNLPKPYVPGNVIFQVLEVEHQVSAGKWETIVTALVRCVSNESLKYKKV